MPSYYPPTFQDFLQTTHSVISWDSTSIGTFTQDPESTPEFGVSGVISGETQELVVTIGQLASGLQFSTIASGFLGIYLVQSGTRQDYLMRTVSFDRDMVVGDHIEVRVNKLPDTEILIVAATLELTANTSISTWALVARDGTEPKALESVLAFVKPRQEIGQERWQEPETRAVISQQCSGTSTLDFTSREPCDQGSLAYQGGGNRYLFADTKSVLQPVNTTPWELHASCFVEPAATQLVLDPGLVSHNWVTTPDIAVVTENSMPLSGFDTAQMLRYVIQQTRNPNSTWEWQTPVTVSAGKHTFSVYAQIDTEAAYKCVYEIGVRIGTIEIVSEIQAGAWTLRSVTGELPAGQGVAFIRVSRLYRNNRVVLQFGLPQLEANWVATSRVTSDRQRDFVIYTPEDVAYPTNGAITFRWYPGYTGAPVEDVTLFDSRSQDIVEAGTNGWYLKHWASGDLVFASVDQHGLEHSVSHAWQATIGLDTVIKCYYASNEMSVYINDVLLASATTAVVVPAVVLPVRLGHDYTETLWMVGELLEFTLPGCADDSEF